MTETREPTSGVDRTDTVRKGQKYEPKELFSVLGQQVEDLNLNNSEGKNGNVGNNGGSKEEPEEFRSGSEKVVEVIESLCMNCHENVSHP